jgi:hypothetical protein
MNRAPVYGTALGVAGSIALLAGCGAPPTSVPAGTTVRSTSSFPGDNRSWMLPEAKSQTLLYISTYINPPRYGLPPQPTVYVYSYPAIKLVGKVVYFNSYANLAGLCSDKQGNVFVTTWLSNAKSGLVYEFAHGATKPTQILNDPGAGFGCSVDPTTGDLAVTNLTGYYGSGNQGNVAIYRKAQGTPTLYDAPNITSFEFCTYNDVGKLFVDGYTASQHTIAYLGQGSSGFTDLQLNVRGLQPLSLQWDQGRLVVANTNNTGPPVIYRFRVVANQANPTGLTKLRSGKHKSWPIQYLIDGSTIMGAGSPATRFLFWQYPKGGWPTGKIMAPQNAGSWLGVALSPAQK